MTCQSMLMTKSSKKAAPAAKPAATKVSTKPTGKTATAATVTKIGKSEMTEMIGDRVGLRKKDAGIALSAALDIIVEALKAGQTVGLPGIGTLTVKATAARIGVRPGTSEKIQIPAGKKVSFKIATELKKSL
jgi:DNA-binding protein HU-beta